MFVRIVSIISVLSSFYLRETLSFRQEGKFKSPRLLCLSMGHTKTKKCSIGDITDGGIMNFGQTLTLLAVLARAMRITQLFLYKGPHIFVGVQRKITIIQRYFASCFHSAPHRNWFLHTNCLHIDRSEPFVFAIQQRGALQRIKSNLIFRGCPPNST